MYFCVLEEGTQGLAAVWSTVQRATRLTAVVDGYGSLGMIFRVGPDLQTATKADGDGDGGMARWQELQEGIRVDDLSGGWAGEIDLCSCLTIDGFLQQRWSATRLRFSAGVSLALAI